MLASMVFDVLLFVAVSSHNACCSSFKKIECYAIAFSATHLLCHELNALWDTKYTVSMPRLSIAFSR